MTSTEIEIICTYIINYKIKFYFINLLVESYFFIFLFNSVKLKDAYFTDFSFE